MKFIDKYLSSNEVAEMVGRTHDNVLKDIRNIVEQIGGVKTLYVIYILIIWMLVPISIVIMKRIDETKVKRQAITAILSASLFTLLVVFLTLI